MYAVHEKLSLTRGLAAAHGLCIGVLTETDACKVPRTWAFVDQIRRAALSLELNIVEGYVLQTKPQFLQHLWIALGSAVEVERLLEIAAEIDYLPSGPLRDLRARADRAIGALYGMLKRMQ